MNLKLRPTLISASDKSSLLSKINQMAGHIGYTSPLISKNNEVVLYNLEKHNKKVKINKRKKKVVTAKGSSFQRDVVKRKEWRAYVYFIPRSLVKSYKQHEQNFTVEFK